MCDLLGWSPQGSAGFALISGDFRASSADSQRKSVCLMVKSWLLTVFPAVLQELRSSAVCGVRWEVTWCLHSVSSAPGQVVQMCKRHLSR